MAALRATEMAEDSSNVISENLGIAGVATHPDADVAAVATAGVDDERGRQAHRESETAAESRSSSSVDLELIGERGHSEACSPTEQPIPDITSAVTEQVVLSGIEKQLIVRLRSP